MIYPPAHKSDLIENYHGTLVADPYRWLEDPDSPGTVAWVEAENQLTRSALDGAARDQLIERLTRLYDFPRTSVPTHLGKSLLLHTQHRIAGSAGAVRAGGAAWSLAACSSTRTR